MAVHEHLTKDLRAAGLSATNQRVALLRALRSLKQPESVEELARRLRATMNTTTVYRALEQLIGAGLARRIELGENYARFEATGRHHHHLVCRSCGKIEDVSICIPATLTSRILKTRSGFASVEDHALEFFGICRACDTKGKK